MDSYPSVVNGDLHGFGAVADAELAEDLRHPVADCALGQPQAARELRRRQALATGGEYLALSIRQRTRACLKRARREYGINDFVASSAPVNRRSGHFNRRILLHNAGDA